MIENYHWPVERELCDKETMHNYKELPPAAGPENVWHDVTRCPPPKQSEVLATDGWNVKEAWVGADGHWMRINARWERVFGATSHVTHWREKPGPPGKETTC